METPLFYFVTYKKNTNATTYPTIFDYNCVFDLMRKHEHLISIDDYVYETDSKGKLHMHLLIRFKAKRGPNFKSMMIKGYHSHYVQVDDIESIPHIREYMAKQYSREQVEAMELAAYYKYHYGFD